MKKTIVLLALSLTLSGCIIKTTQKEWGLAEKLCENNEGLKYYIPSAFSGKVICNNSALFTITFSYYDIYNE